jgi:antitoxin component of MazEF toxin-antitoxin module
MLKKLVKYGNSTALVLDKAILELLGMAEGSIVKIKTDGTSLIITPQGAQEPEKVSESVDPAGNPDLGFQEASGGADGSKIYHPTNASRLG